MKLGVMYPQTDVACDPVAVREFAQAIEQMGFNHMLAIEHVIGANPASRPPTDAPYGLESSFIEPFVLLTYIAAVAPRLELATGILILPQRQTVLVAKQAACLDVLCGGRLRLGVGTGWNPVEYEALGYEFGNRAPRYEEQIDLLRRLWTEPAITSNGAFHTITDAGINPLPVQRPIPLWLGGGGLPGAPLWLSPGRDNVVRRVARVADGWIPNWRPDEHGEAMMDRLRAHCREFGRSPATIGLEGRITLDPGTMDCWLDELAAWRAIGATHVTLNTMGCGISGNEAILRQFEAFASAAGTRTG